MPIRNCHRVGDYLMVSDFSGRAYYASEMRKTWEGFWVHRSEWEPKHPQLDVAGLPREARLHVIRPRASVTAACATELLTVVGSTNVSFPFGPATHIFEGTGIGDWAISCNFRVS